MFYWNLDFGWREVEREDWSLYPTPAMAGGLFSIRFKFVFLHFEPYIHIPDEKYKNLLLQVIKKNNKKKK